MKINKRTAIYLGIFLVLFMMTVGNAAAVQEEGTRRYKNPDHQQ